MGTLVVGRGFGTVGVLGALKGVDKLQANAMIGNNIPNQRILRILVFMIIFLIIEFMQMPENSLNYNNAKSAFAKNNLRL